MLASRKNQGSLIPILLLSVVAWQLGGCVVGQSISLDHNPIEPQQESTEKSVTVTVSDERGFVIDGQEPASYIGQYRAGFGNPWDVTTGSGEALAEIFKNDLKQELENMGFAVEDQNADGSLGVIIKDWNFDTYTNGSFQYDLLVSVISSDGKELATSKVRDMHSIQGSLMTGAKAAMEEKIPVYYDGIIDAILRANELIREALESL